MCQWGISLFSFRAKILKVILTPTPCKLFSLIFFLYTCNAFNFYTYFMTLLRNKTQYLQKTFFFATHNITYLYFIYVYKNNNKIYIAKLYIQLIYDVHIYTYISPILLLLLLLLFSAAIWCIYYILYCKQQLHLILYKFQNKTTKKNKHIFLPIHLLFLLFIWVYMFPYIPIYIYVCI